MIWPGLSHPSSHQHGTEGGEEKKGRTREGERAKGKRESKRVGGWRGSRVRRAALPGGGGGGGGAAGEGFRGARGEHGCGGFGGVRSKR